MTSRHEARPIPRWLIAVGVCAAFLAQLALPTLHALETEAVGLHAALAGEVSSSFAPIVAATSEAPPAHESATCPICQSLTRTKPIAVALVSPAPSCCESTSAPLAVLPRVSSTEAQSGHPPRAPPSIHLA